MSYTCQSSCFSSKILSYGSRKPPTYHIEHLQKNMKNLQISGRWPSHKTGPPVLLFDGPDWHLLLLLENLNVEIGDLLAKLSPTAMHPSNQAGNNMRQLNARSRKCCCGYVVSQSHVLPCGSILIVGKKTVKYN